MASLSCRRRSDTSLGDLENPSLPGKDWGQKKDWGKETKGHALNRSEAVRFAKIWLWFAFFLKHSSMQHNTLGGRNVTDVSVVVRSAN